MPPLLALVALADASSGEAQDGARGAAQDAARNGGPAVDPTLQRALDAGSGAGELRAVVTFENRRAAERQTARVEGLGLDVHTFDVLPMVGVRGTAAEVRGILDLPGVESVWGDRKLEYLLRESRALVGADKVENRFGVTGKGVGVAVIDSGVDGTNRDVGFGDEMVQNVKIAGDGFFSGATATVEDQPNTDTSSGHGTHVAGTIGGSGESSGGEYTGIAPGSDLVGIGAGDALFILYTLEGFDYALENQREYDIRVISNSWGTSGKFRENDPVDQASKMAHNRGMTVVFAAGNAGPGRDTLNPYSVAPWVIGVAAGTKSGKGLADFSSRGRPGSGLYAPDITAPGVNIVSARASTGATINALAAADDATYIPPEYQPFYITSSGTSMATPHVSGAVALLEEAKPSLGPDEIRKLLQSTATPMPRYREFEVGAGYLDAFGAVSEARGPGN